MSRKEHIAFIGLRRSGNHTLIEWTAENFKVVKHHNDCIIKNKTFRSQSPTQTYLGKGDDETVFFSFEERTVKEPGVFLENYDETFDRMFFIMRDAYNWGASILIGRSSESLRSSIDVWKRFGRLYLRIPDQFLLYDSFVTNPYYIKSVKEIHNLQFSPDSLPNTFPKSGIGKGSSFKSFPKDATAFVKRDQRVRSHFKNKLPESWKQLINDPEVDELNRQIFGRGQEDIK